MECSTVSWEITYLACTKFWVKSQVSQKNCVVTLYELVNPVLRKWS